MLKTILSEKMQKKNKVVLEVFFIFFQLKNKILKKENIVSDIIFYKTRFFWAWDFFATYFLPQPSKKNDKVLCPTLVY